MYEIKNILVPVDFSECARAAFDHAMALAQTLGARVTVYHVAEVSPAFSTLKLSAERGSTLGEHALTSGKRELDAFLAEAAPAWKTQPAARVVAGDPRDCILREAEDGKYDLLVMGTHGRTGRARSLAGSVAESIVRSASCPVMTVREPG